METVNIITSNDKEEQIRKMARLIDDRLIEASGVLGSMNNGKGYWIAQKLIEYYQPKLSEDGVALLEQELDTLLYARIPFDMEVEDD